MAIKRHIIMNKKSLVKNHNRTFISLDIKLEVIILGNCPPLVTQQLKHSGEEHERTKHIFSKGKHPPKKHWNPVDRF